MTNKDKQQIYGALFRVVFTEPPVIRPGRDGQPGKKATFWGWTLDRVFDRRTGARTPTYRRFPFTAWAGDVQPPPLGEVIEIDAQITVGPRADGQGLWSDVTIKDWRPIPLPDPWRGVPIPERGGYGRPPQSSAPQQGYNASAEQPTPQPARDPFGAPPPASPHEPPAQPPASPWGAYDDAQDGSAW